MDDQRLDQSKYQDKVIIDFENVPLPNIGDKDIVCIGINTNGSQWPDHTEINDNDWVLLNQCQNQQAWSNTDDGLMFDTQESKMSTTMPNLTPQAPTQTANYQSMPKDEPTLDGVQKFDFDGDFHDDEF